MVHGEGFGGVHMCRRLGPTPSHGWGCRRAVRLRQDAADDRAHETSRSRAHPPGSSRRPRARLADRGSPPDAADRAVTAQEEAAARGLPGDAPTFWSEGEAWILAGLSSGHRHARPDRVSEVRSADRARREVLPGLRRPIRWLALEAHDLGPLPIFVDPGAAVPPGCPCGDRDHDGRPPRGSRLTECRGVDRGAAVAPIRDRCSRADSRHRSAGRDPAPHRRRGPGRPQSAGLSPKIV
jgi:hypothetical protein